MIVSYPNASKLNPSLLKIVKDNYVCLVQGGGRRTAFNIHQKKIKEVDILLTWIRSLLPKVAYEFTRDGKDVRKIEEVGFNINGFEIKECWGIYYNKGEGVVKHNHFPYTLSFIYCVNIPDKSSSIIIEGKKILQKAGTILFFLSHQQHWVESCTSNNKCVITGNILYET